MSSTEIVTTETVNLQTGEVIPLDDPTEMARIARDRPDALAAYVRYIDEDRRYLDALRAEVGRYLIERMDTDATQTLHAGALTVTINGGSDTQTVYDADALHDALLGLVAEGVLSDAAVAKAIRVKREASASGINSLRALHNQGVDAAIEHAAEVKAKPRRVTVK